MSNVIISESFRLCEGLHGHIEYYETILEKNGLVAREGEFRSYKLGLTIGLLRVLYFPENLKRSLISEIIEAWRLSVPEKTLEQREEEMRSMQKSIDDVRRAIAWAEQHKNPSALKSLSSAVMFALPLLPSDLRSERISIIHDMIGEVMDFFSSKASNPTLTA